MPKECPIAICRFPHKNCAIQKLAENCSQLSNQDYMPAVIKRENLGNCKKADETLDYIQEVFGNKIKIMNEEDLQKSEEQTQI